MSYTFVFDLDSTITQKEILPEIAKIINMGEQLRLQTDLAMTKNLDFKQNFLERVELLKNIDLEKARTTTKNIPLNEKIAEFIQQNNCFIVTGNLDIWISDLLVKLGMQDNCYSSHAKIDENNEIYVYEILDKANVIANMKGKIVTIGDGTNDIEMLKKADIGIAFSGCHKVCKELLEVADYHFKNETDLVNFLNSLNNT